ncbi:MAG: isocitrate lyase/phosphoenolpyruvate mutase family protein [Alphaproteobacteria bacterium]|nr:isocitrate lyase/phosphoenolpyruvate mutase family protein [Alphaproteobacteria bacterium]
MSSKIDTFRRLHERGCFVIPNPWDAGSAIYLEKLGFKAVASTSAGFAWSQGHRDNDVTLDELLAHLKTLAGAVTIPVNADFEDGLAVEPDGVAANVAKAVATGIAGLSIEDSTRGDGEPLYAFSDAVDRIKAARASIDKSGSGVLLTARSEGFIRGRPDLAETIKRLQAFAAAGADCLFAPGLSKKDDIAAVVKAIAPKPVNLIGGPWITVAEVAELGVRRISVGGSLARAAWRGFSAAAKEIAEQGTFGSLAGPKLDLDAVFD